MAGMMSTAHLASVHNSSLFTSPLRCVSHDRKSPKVCSRTATRASLTFSSIVPATLLSKGIIQQQKVASTSSARSVQFRRRLVPCSAASADGGAGGDGSSSGGGSGGRGKITATGDNGENEDGNDNKEDEDKALSLQEVEKWMAKHGVQLPADMLAVAAKFGLRQSVLTSYLALKDGAFTGYFLRTVPWVRDRLLADHRFLFKVVAEVLIDSGCATVAEIRKRGDDFWKEFEFYVSDLIVGCVLDVALVGLMAPAAVLGAVSRAAMASSPLQRWLATIPSAVFAASVPGAIRYSFGSRLACLGVKFCEYSLAGMACGFVGQGLANSLMLLRRHFQGESEDDVPVPPLVTTALVWGLFMGVSANVRYQIVFGLERAVDLTIAKHVPQIAYGTTVAIRFINNVIGGENFIDMARWAGVQ